jgi:hypothetical protein
MPRIDAAADRDEPHPLGHRRVDDPVDAQRRAQPVDAEGGGDIVDSHLGGRTVEPAPSAEKARGVEIAEHQIGVGYRRGGAARAVARRTRYCPGALRADMQNPAGIDPGDRPTACTDAGNVEAAERNRVAGNPAGRRQARPAIDDQ